MTDAPSTRPNSSFWLISTILALLCLVLRAANITALPIFSDEAIYLRWAQLIRAGYPWISVVDPKPPLHFWLIAAVYDFSTDPLRAARMLSAFAGALTIPAIMLLAEELGHLIGQPQTDQGGVAPLPSGRVLGLLAALFAIFCPFLAFYQRLASADALFVLEMLLALWLSLRWARRAAEGQNAWPAAIAMA